MTDIEKKAVDLRKKFIKTASVIEATHVASSLSCIDIITALYTRPLEEGEAVPDRSAISESKLVTRACHSGRFDSRLKGRQAGGGNVRLGKQPGH